MFVFFLHICAFILFPLSFQASHGHSRPRGVHSGAGDAGYVRWDEAGSRRYRPLRHCPVPKSEKPYRGPRPLIPGHAAQPLPAKILSLSDQRVSVVGGRFHREMCYSGQKSITQMHKYRLLW